MKSVLAPFKLKLYELFAFEGQQPRIVFPSALRFFDIMASDEYAIEKMICHFVLERTQEIEAFHRSDEMNYDTLV